ncbi:MAG: excinuclease ABC subunit UvrC [Bacteroidota bacterium]
MEEQRFENVIVLSKDDVSLAEKLETLPTQPGVYQFKSADNTILYVGKAINLRNRVRQYFQKSYRPDPRRERMVSKIKDVELIVTLTEVDALILETTLIKKYKPRYNIDLKDDKSYPYIVITKEPYPRVFATRRIIRDGSRYFGPYTDVKNMHASLKMVREIYKVRSCNYHIDEEAIRKKKYKLCFDYHIKKCDGPCEALVSYEQYNAMIAEVAQIIKGKTTSLVKLLGEKMEKASVELRFEEAAQLRDKIRQLQLYSEKQKIVDWEMIDRDICAFALNGDDACGVVFQIRDGKIIGKQHFYMTHVEGKQESELIEHLLERYYFDTEDLPAEIFLPTELENAGTIKEWLAARGGKEITFTIPKIGEKAKLMNMCKNNAQFLLDVWLLKKAKQADYIPHSVIALQRDLRLQKQPRRIECFDISNIQGSDSVASMVVFVDAKPRKSEYRKFKIRNVKGPDDFASMREVIERRYSRVLAERSDLPDLIMVDGGKGQLSSAVEVLIKLGLHEPVSPVDSNQTHRGLPLDPATGKYVESDSLEQKDNQKDPTAPQFITDIPIIGLAKRLEEVFGPGASDPQTIPKTSSGLKLLQQIRDEAHRFAITYHRSLRKKRTLQTELDLIAGIGKKRAKELLEVFGSVQGVKFATAEQLEEIVGNTIAVKIKEYFSEDEPDGV